MAARPVRAPAATPVVDSTKEVTVVVPQTAEAGADRVDDHRAAIVHGHGAVFVDHAGALLNANEGAGRVEEVGEEKSEDERVARGFGKAIEAAEDGTEDLAKVADLA